jgi:hypothetical protein
MSAGHLFLSVMASLVLLVSPLVLFAHFCLFGAFANGSRLDGPFGVGRLRIYLVNIQKAGILSKLPNGTY